MTEADLLTPTAADGRDLLAAAAMDWTRPVPHCPGWDTAELVRHMGSILGWMAAVVTSGERVSRRSLDPAPRDVAELPTWYTAQVDHTVGLLAAANPDQPVWTFSARGDQRVGWWQRRLSVELAIHRWDAQAAGDSAPAAVDGEVAAAGVAEFLTEFLPGLLAADGVTGLEGTLHLHATDGPTEWWIDLDAKGDAEAVAHHAKADTAIRGTRSDLLLWLTNRRPTRDLAVIGPTAVVQRWRQLRR